MRLAFAAVDDNAPVSLTAAGSSYTPAFSLSTAGIAPLTLTSDALVLDATAPLALTWTPGANPDARITVRLDISHHGGTRGKIECVTDDDGALAVDAALVDRLLDLGVSGFPTVIVAREHSGNTVLRDGRVDLVVTSIVERAVAIPGLTSCFDDADCAVGQTCQADLRCE